MSTNTLSTLRGTVAIMALLSVSSIAHAQTATKPAGTPPKAKISAKQAEAVAVKKIGGKVLSTKYEFEDGHWQYAVIVRNKKGEWYEVAVNPTTAAVLNTEKTSATAEAKEDAEGKKKATGAKP